jgi:hypothetical protein
MEQLELPFPRGPRPRGRHLFMSIDDKFPSLDKDVLDKVERGEWHRASGSMICGWCHYEYRDHLQVHLGLTQLCDKTLVHL